MDTELAIRTRKTEKCLADPNHLAPVDHERQSRVKEDIRELLELAGHAPFHKPAHSDHLKTDTDEKASLDAVMPWRFYVLDQAACQSAVALIRNRAANHQEKIWHESWQSKIPWLLAGADALILTYWLPDPQSHPTTQDAPEWTLFNQEHLAAASAATQTLLLAATARQYHNYWSSGGIFRSSDMQALLNISPKQVLLGAVFLTHSASVAENTAIKEGGMRSKRTPPEHWSKWVAPSLSE